MCTESAEMNAKSLNNAHNTNENGNPPGENLTYLFWKGRRPPTPTRGPGARARARARAKYPGMFNDFAVISTPSVHMLCTCPSYGSRFY